MRVRSACEGLNSDCEADDVCDSEPSELPADGSLMSVSLGKHNSFRGMLLLLKTSSFCETQQKHSQSHSQQFNPTFLLMFPFIISLQVSGVVMIGVGFSSIDGNTPVAEVTVCVCVCVCVF